MNEKFKKDYYRMTGKKWTFLGYVDMFLRYDLRYLWHIRRKNKKSIFYKLRSISLARRYGLEILSSSIGEGLYIGHAHNINVHPYAVIGKNCNLNKGCTVGKENRGKRNGAPTLGNFVWVGTNAVIVGKITIGDDVLIAPNSYINFDVPSHSIVVGNPARIIHRDNATESYIQNVLED
jgi:serine O-acetyltransferase